MEAGKRRLAGDTARAATSDGVKDLRRESRELKEVVAEQTLELVFGRPKLKLLGITEVHKSIDDQDAYITRTGAPVQLVIQDIIKTLTSYCGEDAMTEVPVTILQFAESTKFTHNET